MIVFIQCRFKQGLVEISNYFKEKPNYGNDADKSKALIDFFSPQLQFINDYAEFKPASLGSEIVGYLVGFLKRNWDDEKECEEIITFFNNVGCGRNDFAKNGRKNAVAWLMAEYDRKNLGRRFPHKSSHRTSVCGLWIKYYEDWGNEVHRGRSHSTKEDVLHKIVHKYFKD